MALDGSGDVVVVVIRSGGGGLKEVLHLAELGGGENHFTRTHAQNHLWL